MSAAEEAKEGILAFVEQWFAHQALMRSQHPEDYEGCEAGDYELWFWESGGMI
jgi:hypothetical protein